MYEIAQNINKLEGFSRTNELNQIVSKFIFDSFIRAYSEFQYSPPQAIQILFDIEYLLIAFQETDTLPIKEKIKEITGDICLKDLANKSYQRCSGLFGQVIMPRNLDR